MTLLTCVLGALYGTLVGALPGITIVSACSIITPFLVHYMSLEHSAIILTSIAYGSQYSSSIGAILLNVPGEGTSAITCLDGYPMAKQGKAKTAIIISAVSSFIAGILSIFFILYMITSMTNVIMGITTKYYLLCLFLTLMLILISFNDNFYKNCLSFLLGMSISLIGTSTGIERLTFNSRYLTDGIDSIFLITCLFGLPMILFDLINYKKDTAKIKNYADQKIYSQDIKASIFPAIRGSIVGFLGMIPGFGFSLSAFLSYTIEKFISKDKNKFGKGAVAGIAGPEAANNSLAQSSMIPFLMMGVPSTFISAILMGLLISKGIEIGPQLSLTHPKLFWTIIGSMFIVNTLLFIINWPLARFWVRLLNIDNFKLFFVVILIIIYSILISSSNIFDFLIISLLACVGYYLHKNNYSVIHVFIGYIYCILFEDNFLRMIELLK
jgi:TctA family transporter